MSRSMRLPAAPPDDEREPDARRHLVPREAGGVQAHADQRRRRNDRDERRLVREVGRIQKAERRAGVEHVREVQETRG